jgi:predicted lipase
VFSHYNTLRAKYPNAKLLITGHSLGGAIATHALIHLKKVFISRYRKAGVKVDEFITYGSPRVGDDKFSSFLVDYHPETKHRLSHSHDPVPHLPLAAQGFKHVPIEIYYPTL